MTTTALPDVTVENPKEWDALAAEVAQSSGLPFAHSLADLTDFVARAVVAIYAADAAGEGGSELLRDVYSTELLARFRPGQFSMVPPTKVGLRLMAVVQDEQSFRLRVKVSMTNALVVAPVRMFWDVAAGIPTVVASAQCPQCGAPSPAEELVCSHCGASLAVAQIKPFLIERTEFFA